MVETRFGHANYKLKPLSERLIQKNPEDGLVVVGTIQILMTDRATLEDNRRAVELVDREIKRTGDNGTKQYFKAFSILAIWQKTKSKSDLKDMQAAAQKCLADKGISNFQRQYCKILLKFIEKELKK